MVRPCTHVAVGCCCAHGHPDTITKPSSPQRSRSGTSPACPAHSCCGQSLQSLVWRPCLRNQGIKAVQKALVRLPGRSCCMRSGCDADGNVYCLALPVASGPAGCPSLVTSHRTPGWLHSWAPAASYWQSWLVSSGREGVESGAPLPSPCPRVPSPHGCLWARRGAGNPSAAAAAGAQLRHRSAASRGADAARLHRAARLAHLRSSL